MSKLVRGLTLTQAVAINTIDMVGIGPFIVIPFIIGAMHGPQCIIAWILGAALAFSDGFVWAELGAKWPEAGGSYAFLQNLFGRQKLGKLMSFLYVWQTVIQAPLVLASGAIGFSQYLVYLAPWLTPLEQKAVSGSLIILVTTLLYRKITDIGKISVFMGIIVGGTILWLIISGFSHFQPALAFTYSKDAFDFTPAFFLGLGQASTKTIYSFLGYYNVCHLGGEIKEPERNIPRSIFISIGIIAALYILMQISVLGVIPWQEAKESKFIISLFFERIYGHTAALVATGLILFIAVSSLFAVMLGYSRVPYAAAIDGNFFEVFGKLHPTKNFPYVSLLFLAGLAFIFSLLFKLSEVITAIIVMRILVQFVGQSVGLLLYHQRKKDENFPYRMWLYPLPPLVGITVWLFVFCSADLKYILGAVGIITLGAMLFYFREMMKKNEILTAYFCDMSKKGTSLYLVSVLLFMLVLPVASIAFEHFNHQIRINNDLIGKWFVFWVVGVRLFIAGIRQVIKPAFTAQEIFHIKSEESFVVVRELGLANICMGLIGMVSILSPVWYPLAALGGGLYFGLAGILHVIKKPVSTNETIAMVSDLLFFALMVVYVYNAFQQAVMS